MTRLMLAVDQNGVPHEFVLEDDERAHITKAGNIRVRGGDSFTQPMETPATVVYELVEEARAA